MRRRRFCAARPETLPAAGHLAQGAPGPEAAPCGIRACPPTCGLRAAWRRLLPGAAGCPPQSTLESKRHSACRLPGADVWSSAGFGCGVHAAGTQVWSLHHTSDPPGLCRLAVCALPGRFPAGEPHRRLHSFKRRFLGMSSMHSCGGSPWAQTREVLRALSMGGLESGADQV